MKASLFLVLAGASFALSSCQEAATPTASEPVAPPAPPIKVSLEKNEIGSVVYGGGLAPASVKGKTIIFNYANAVARNGELGDKGDFEYTPAKIETFKPDSSIHFKNGNVNKKDFYIVYAYKKVNNTTATIDRNTQILEQYTLKFTTPTSGTAEFLQAHGDYSSDIKGITFTIK